MIEWASYFLGFAAIMTAGATAWIVSVFKRDVSIVDSLWALMFGLAAFIYALYAPTVEARGVVVLVLVLLWAARLSGYITWRNWGEPEDRRYRDIRKRNEPNFAFKSFYLVFALQGVLAWIVSLPLLVVMGQQAPLGWLDYLGIGLWCVGMIFETGADAQLARFRARKHNEHAVLDKGLWRYSRHPNYFGNFCIWWGFYLIAMSADGWWSIISPLLMSFLLLKVSGVTLLEKDINSRRPEYKAYIERTSAFFPWPPRQSTSAHSEESIAK